MTNINYKLNKYNIKIDKYKLKINKYGHFAKVFKKDIF